MAQASIESPMSGQAESSTAATIFRNDDPLTHALRDGVALNMDDIARLNRAMPPVYGASSSVATLTAEVFSTQDDSSITKPTSTGTPYVNNVYKGKGKGRMSCASSLSVAHGSESEAEAQQHATRKDALLAVGHWAAGAIVSAEPLKGAARAKKRCYRDRRPNHKKPVVEIVQRGCAPMVAFDGDHESVVTIAPVRGGLERTYLRRRSTHHDEEGQCDSTPIQGPSRKSLSPARFYILVGLILMISLTIALAILGAHHTGKARMACTKGIIFGATVILAFFTVLAMIVARQALQDALLAGLLENAIGFTLLLELDDFM